MDVVVVSWLTLAAIAGVAAGLLMARMLLPGQLESARQRALAEVAPEQARIVAHLEAVSDAHSQSKQQLERAERELVALRDRADLLSDQRSDLAARAERVSQLGSRLDERESELRALRDERDQQAMRSAELAARLEEQQASSEARLQELRDARERLKAEFQTLASDLLEAKAKKMNELGEQQLGQVLNPLREQLGEFRRMVGDVYEKENVSRVALQSRIDELVKLNQTLGAEATSLSRALSSDNRTQGYWGELKLERLLESAGLQKGSEYLTQESFKDSDGDRFRPDAVLKLPEGRDIVIDAKVALLDYQRFCEAVDEPVRQQHLLRHVAALRRHINELGEKDYSQLIGLQSPDLVLMFIPVEAAFLEALRADQTLYDDAFKKRIVLVGPSNLLASLRLIAQIWRSDQQNKNAKEIADKAGKLYDKFVGFVEDLNKVGDLLGKAQAMQQSALGKLSLGKGNLVRKVDELRKLGVTPSKQLPVGMLNLATDSPSTDDESDSVGD